MRVIIGKPYKLAKSLVKWGSEGFPTADVKLLEQRQNICNSCEHWSPAAFAGLGRCKICGCTRYKLNLKTEKCPKGKW